MPKKFTVLKTFQHIRTSPRPTYTSSVSRSNPTKRAPGATSANLRRRLLMVTEQAVLFSPSGHFGSRQYKSKGNFPSAYSIPSTGNRDSGES